MTPPADEDRAPVAAEAATSPSLTRGGERDATHTVRAEALVGVYQLAAELATQVSVVEAERDRAVVRARHLESLIRSAPVAWLILDGQGRINDLSDRAARLLRDRPGGAGSGSRPRPWSSRRPVAPSPRRRSLVRGR